MPQSDLAELLDITAASSARSLHQLAEVAVRSVAGCAAANVISWLGDEPPLVASSHPDLATLIAVQLACGCGPAFEARLTDEPVSCPDLLGDERWPEYATAALGVGIRCTLTLSYRDAPGVVTLTLAGARPDKLDPRDAATAEMLASLGGAVLGAVSRYDDARRTASQLLDAAESRAVVDQAKGILMYALGCSADEALDQLRRASQQRNVRAVDVARDIVASGGRMAAGQPGRPRTAVGRPGRR